MQFNAAQVHLLVNHVPVIGFLGMTSALIIALVLKSVDIKRFVLLATVIIGVSTVAPFWSGEPAEEVIEKYSGISENLIEKHEGLAETATGVSLATAMVAGFAFLLQMKRPETLNKVVPVVLVFSVVSTVTLGITAHSGGLIRHPEIESSGTIPNQNSDEDDD